MLVPRIQRALFMQPSRYFKEFSAVKNISLTIGRGETIGIIGRNGSGKSTLLQMIVGTLTPTSGTVEVDGRIAALLELGAGFNPEFTGRENVYVNGAILGFSREEMDARFEAIAAFAAIGDFIERPVKTYSSGMFIRLAFAVATAVEPDILVVDEALAVGDEAFQRKCFARIEAIKERGGTILFVSHGAQTIVQLCDRAVLLDGGEKILEGEPKLVVGQYQRLVNASDEAAADIRSGIVNATSGQAKPGSATVENHDETHSVIEEQTDSFDSNLVSLSEVEYASQSAFIGRPQLLDSQNNPVNCITNGRRYKYTYDVIFTEDSSQVGFGMLIKTSSGLELGGAASAFEKSLLVDTAQKGQRIQVEFEFECVFQPGLYFVNAGVVSMTGGHMNYLHRRLDALLFRVQPKKVIIATGLIDIKPDVRFLVVP